MRLCGYEVGPDRPFFLIAGPCVIESESLVLEVAGRMSELTPKRGLTPDQYEHLGRLLKQFSIDQSHPIADFRAVQDLLAGELPTPLVLRRVEKAKPRMREDKDRWHFHQVLLHFLGDAA